MAENLNTLYYALELDDVKMQQQLQEAIENLSNLDKEFDKINKAIEDTFKKNIGQSPVQKEIKGLTARLKDLEKQWKNLEVAERRGAEGQRIRTEYESLRKEAGNLNNSLAKLYSESQKAASSQKGLAAQLGLVNNQLTLQNRIASNINTLFTTTVSIFAAKSFVQNLAQVRGEFENQQIALRAILRDAEAADKIFGQIKSFAVVSPFEFKDLVGYAKQLSAFQVPVDELFETTKRLADVSAGLGVGMDRIILAYGQVRSAAVLRGQELRQFTEAGIPLVDELAKKFSELEGRVVSAGDVFEKISNRMVSFEMVKEIFEDMTNEGGMFYMMQEKQAESLKGKIANLADAYDIMLNDIGEANDGILKGGVEGIAALFENWEKVWRILKSLILGYGTYKAAIIAVNVVQKANIGLNTVANFIEMSRVMSIATKQTNLFATAQNILNKTLLSNPYVAIATALGTLVGGLILFNNTTKSTQEIIQNLEDNINKLESPIQNINTLINNYEVLTAKVNRDRQEQEELNKTIAQLSKTVKDSASSFDAQGNALDININKVKEYRDALIETAKIESQKALGEAEKRISELEQRRDELQKAVSTGRGQTRQLETGELIDFEYSENAINKFKSELLSIEVEYGNLSSKILEYNNKISDSNKRLSVDKGFSDWQKKLNDAIYKLDISQNFKDIYSVRDFKDTFETLKNNVVQEYQKLNDELERINKTSGIFDKKYADNLKKRFGEINKLLLLYGGLDEGNGPTKDPNADRFKEQIDLIKKAQAQYEKYLQIMSPNEALATIRTDQQFMALDIQFEPDKVRERLQMVMNDIGKLPQSPELEKLKKSIQASFTDIDYTEAKKNFDQLLDDLTKEIDTYKDKYNFYEQLLGITGDQNLAVNLAFNGDFEKAGKGIIEHIQQGMIDAASDTGLTLEQIMNLDFTKSAQDLGISEKLKAFLQKSVDEIGKIQVGNVLDFQKLIAEYSSVEDKIKTIQSKGAAERAKISETFARQRIDVDEETYVALEEQELAAIIASKKREDEAVRGLMSEMLQLTPFWQKLFGDLDQIGYQSLTKLSDRAKEVVDSAKVKKDKDNKVLGYTVKLDDKDYDISVELFEKLRKQSNSLDKNLKASNPFKTLFDTLKEGPQVGEDFFDFATRISESLNGIIGIASDVGASLSEMFSAIGNDKAAETIDFSFQLADALGGMLTDLASGNPVQMVAGMVKGVAKIVTLFSQKHDNKLEKQIQESILAIQKLQGVYSELERMISRNLGGAQYLDLGLEDTDKRLAEINNQISQLQAKSKNNIILKIRYSSNIKELEKEQKKLQAYRDGGAYAVQRENLIQQQEELRKQRQAEIDKKKTDQSKVADYENQIKELDDTIRHFAEDTLKELYNIDLKDWAAQIGDVLFDAWKKGEDGAEAFRNKVGELMGEVMNEILKIKVLEPAMKDLENKLFGADGKSGYFGKDFELSDDEVVDIAKSLMSVQDSTDKYNKAMDKVEEELNKFGVSMKESNEKDEGLSNGIKSITEDTAQLIASYMNAVRGSVLLQELYMKNIDTNVAGIYQAMGGNPNITTTTTLPPEIIAAISEPMKLNNSLLANIDMNMTNVHSIAANALAQLVLIQANTYNAAVQAKRCADYFESIIKAGHPMGGSGINVFA